ncbi:bi-domain-containing oxidoreductase [Hyphomicrobium sp. D-2]|uniref:bi-domain-containing oxidoreductase n=1 Tax=Hyphomicrobium sp. D-2 TaxID=3041621 RepID=UPI002457BD82|nr:bi-domain-containing oxidoreductase [Hyphomicrobium sp. D-2]MDH4980677.1 bi-domain-containing oxidoreductase [Hyphomicrobium sp. D-2]
MKQILQSLRSGTTEIAEVPCPAAGRGQVLIRTHRTLVSAGTERMLVDFGKAGLIGKARQQPDKVRQVLEKIKTDGLVPTLETVFNKLDQPLPLGYCNVGTVLDVGSSVTGIDPGARVVSNGKHAEAVAVPANLCAPVPETVSDDEAAFTVLGAIALQGIRLVKPTLGETVVVTGLGLIGLMTVQLLRAHGCRVLGLDFDRDKLRLAQQFGAETVDLSTGTDPVATAQTFSRGRGVDAVIITASTTSNEPVHQAALMCRKRGRIVLVGVTGLSLSRADFYEKELIFQVSCSYGPGRYDPNYEEKGQDYPVGFVRWTEQRNFEAVLDMLADGRLDVKPLISHRFPLADAAKAYELVTGDEPSLGILLEYPTRAQTPDAILTDRTVTLAPVMAASNSKVVAGVIGSGNYATAVLVPAFKAAGAQLENVVSSAGVSGVHAGRKFGFRKATTDANSVFNDGSINAIVISTRHDSHADLVCRALQARKHVFAEKPLALSLAELDTIVAERRAAIAAGFNPVVMVGFNRRFAPHIQKIKTLISESTGPKSFVMTVNAGAIPADHWTQDRAAGGGRIIGEACHFIDLLRFLADASITAQHATIMATPTGDTATLTLAFDDGSIGAIHYFANGSKAFPKERLEIFAGGRILQLDNFRKLRGYGWPGFKTMKLWRQDKGQATCAAAFVDAIQHGGTAPIPFAELVEVSRVTIALAGEVRS